MKKVVVYSKPDCGRCMLLKRWLDVKGIEYLETDITENKDSYNKIVEANRISLPVLEIDNKFVEYKEYNDILEML